MRRERPRDRITAFRRDKVSRPRVSSQLGQLSVRAADSSLPSASPAAPPPSPSLLDLRCAHLPPPLGRALRGASRPPRQRPGEHPAWAARPQPSTPQPRTSNPALSRARCRARARLPWRCASPLLRALRPARVTQRSGWEGGPPRDARPGTRWTACGRPAAPRAGPARHTRPRTRPAWARGAFWPLAWRALGALLGWSALRPPTPSGPTSRRTWP